MNILGDALTRPYTTSNGSLYAKIANIPLGLFGEPVYSTTLFLTIRLYSLKSTGRLASKEYYVGFTGDGVNIIDNDYGNPGPDLVARISNGVTELYVSGYEDVSPVRAQIIYCNRPGYIELLNNSYFDTDLSTGTVYKASNSVIDYKTYPFEFLNGWKNASYRGRQYSSNGIMYVDFAISGGTVSSPMYPFTLPVPTTEGKEFPVVFTDSDGSFKVARMTINGYGTPAIYGVTNNTLVSGSFFYRMI